MHGEAEYKTIARTKFDGAPVVKATSMFNTRIYSCMIVNTTTSAIRLTLTVTHAHVDNREDEKKKHASNAWTWDRVACNFGEFRCSTDLEFSNDPNNTNMNE